jgi:hypothetical protein
MALAGSIVVGLALLIGALNGLRRGALKEGMALIGILLGVLLVAPWSGPWGIVLTRRIGWPPITGQWIAALGLLWGTALLSGYGSGALLPWRQTRIPALQRGIGALLGLLNGGLLAGFTLRYTQLYYYGEATLGHRPTWIRDSVASNFLLDRLDLLLLGLAWTVAVASLIVSLVQLVRRLRAHQATSSVPAPSAPATPAADSLSAGSGTTVKSSTPPGMERSFLEKPRTPGGGRP